MQTFLPLPGYRKSAKVLDMNRLGNQRVECRAILQNLLGERDDWVGHPAVEMWRDYEQALCRYAFYIMWEWEDQGYENNLTAWFMEKYFSLPDCAEPWWLGNELFHASHRSKLLGKNPEWYSQFEWNEPDDMPYYWPIKDFQKSSILEASPA